MTLLAWCVAWLDLIIGDPELAPPGTLDWPPHYRHATRRQALLPQRQGAPHRRRADVAGGGRADVGRFLGRTDAAESIHPWLGWVIEVWMIFTLLAGRCLATSARDVERPLREGDLAQSREKLVDRRAGHVSAPAGAD